MFVIKRKVSKKAHVSCRGWSVRIDFFHFSDLLYIHVDEKDVFISERSVNEFVDGILVLMHVSLNKQLFIRLIYFYNTYTETGGGGGKKKKNI